MRYIRKNLFSQGLIFVDVRKIMQKLIFVDTIKIQVSLAFILVDHNLAVIFRGENPILS